MLAEFKFNLIYYILELIMKIPFHCLRMPFLRKLLKSCGNQVEICRDVELRCAFNISIGNGCTINKNVLLDGRGGCCKLAIVWISPKT